MERIQTRSLVTALIGLLGAWLLLRQVPDYASSIFIVLSGGDELPTDLLKVHALHLAVNAVLGAFLILMRGKLARWLVPTEAVNSFDGRSFIAVGTAVIGVYFVALGVTSFGESFAIQQSPNTSNPYLFWRGIFALSTGLVLFVGSVGISRLWALIAGLRDAGETGR